MSAVKPATRWFRVAGCWFAVLLLIGGLTRTTLAQRTGHTPAQLQDVGIDEQLGERIPGDLVFYDEQGREVELSSFFDGHRPVLLALVYHECPMFCNLVLHGLSTAVAEMDWTPGIQYDVLAVSFNPRETPEIARQEKEMIVRMMDRPEAAPGMHFLTGDEASIEALTSAVGFSYRWVEEQKEYAHPSALIFLSGDGTISRYIYGIDYPAHDVRRALVEASNGKVGNTLDRLILYCFQYDPKANSYVPHALNLMKIGGIMTMVLLGGMLFVYWRRESHRSNLQASI